MIVTKKIPVPSYEVLLPMCCAFTLACYWGSYMRFPVVPLFARSLGADVFHVGMINASFMLTAGMLSLPFGILSDRLGRKRLIMGGLLAISLSSLLLYFCSSPLQMIGIYFLFGVGLASFAPTMMSFVTDFSPVTHLGRSYGWYTLAVYGGMSVGPATGGAVAEWFGFQTVFLSSGIIILTTLGMVFFFMPRARHVLIHRPPRRPTMEVARDLMKNTPLWACWLATMGGCLGLGMFITFMPMHAQEQGVNLGQIGVIFGAQGLFNALSRIPFGRLSDKIGKRSNLVVVGLVGFALSVAGLGVAHDLVAFTFFASLAGVSMGLAFTAVGALIAELVSPDCRGLAMGGYNSAIYMGMMLSSLVMGAVIREVGFRNTFLIVGTINLVTAGLFHAVLSNAYAHKSLLAQMRP